MGITKESMTGRGGIPLSVGEVMTVLVNNNTLIYELSDKKITCNAESEDQIVDVIHTLHLD